MRSTKARFVTASQQVLALGAVLAVLAPAASVISLDVVRQPGGAEDVVTAPGSTQQATQQPGGDDRDLVETEPVETELTEHEMASVAEQGGQPPRSERRAAPGPSQDPGREEDEDHEGHAHAEDGHSATVAGRPAAMSEVEDVEGFGTVGVTWDPTRTFRADEITVQARTRTDGVWSDWTTIDYQPDEAPDTRSAEGRQARPGTSPLVVGEVDQVQARALTTTGEAPEGLSLAVISAGEGEGTVEVDPEEVPSAAGTGDEDGTEDAAIALQSVTAPKPTIRSRKAWGANEAASGRPTYARVHGGVIHHTVTANSYTKSQVPGMIRSIHTFHTRSRGWKDIGYNFLVDKFGRIWEGRKGGVGKAVQGAQAAGYNHVTFGASALGNFETAQPPTAMVRAYKKLFAWKLGHHGVKANTTWTYNGRRFNTIIGHRDVGSTACPGQHLYRKLGNVRRGARNRQENAPDPAPTPEPTPEPEPEPEPVTAEPAPESDLVGTPHADLMLRRSSDQRGVILPTEGLLRYTKGKPFQRAYRKFDTLEVSPDLTGNGRPDLLARRAASKVTVIRQGRPNGRFGPVAVRLPGRFARYDLITSVGDLDGDGRHDFVARRGKKLVLLSQRPNGNYKPTVVGPRGFKRYDLLAGVGDITGDGHPDVLARDRRGRLFHYRGTGSRKILPRRLVGTGYGDYESMSGFGDATGDGRADLLVRSRDGYVHVLPGDGAGGFGEAHGPVTRIPHLRNVTAGGSVGRGEAPDFVAQARGGKLRTMTHSGRYDTGQPVETNLKLGKTDLVLNGGDWNGDGHGDVVFRMKNGSIHMRPGNGRGHFGKPVRLGTRKFGGHDIDVVGDVTGDGKPDVIVHRNDGRVTVWPGRGARMLSDQAVVAEWDAPEMDLGRYGDSVWSAGVGLTRGPERLAREDGTGRLYAVAGDRSRHLGDVLEGYELR